MGYIKAVDVLPPEVVKQIQEYINGAVIYIPKKKGTREAWEKGLLQKQSWQSEILKYTRNFCKGFLFLCWLINTF